MMGSVSAAYVLNQLAGMKFPEQGGAYDYMKRCFESPENNPMQATSLRDMLHLLDGRDMNVIEDLLWLVLKSSIVAGAVFVELSGLPDPPSNWGDWLNDIREVARKLQLLERKAIDR